MNKIVLACLAAITLTACSDSADTTATKSESNNDAKDAWFIHRITSTFEKDHFGTKDCHVNSEFENKGDVPLNAAQVNYTTVLIDNSLEGSIDNQPAGAELVREYDKPNLNPLRPGEIRAASAMRLYQPCEVFKGLRLKTFVAQGIDPDGTPNYGSVKAGLSSLIVENQTDLELILDD